MEKFEVLKKAGRIAGWMTTEELEWLYEQAGKMKSIVEIGSWAGRSTFVLASACRGSVTAIDTWDVELMKPWGAADQARGAFAENLADFDNLETLEMKGLVAAKEFKNKSVDMVFIDTDHEYEDCLAIIQAWLPKTKMLICGHDFSNNWPGVKRAVKEIFGAKFKLCSSIWFVNLGRR